MSVWTLLLVCSILCDGVSAADFPPFDASVWIVVWVLAGVCVVLLIVVVVLSVLLALSKKKARLQAKAPAKRPPPPLSADAFTTSDTDLNTHLVGATSDVNMDQSSTPGSSVMPSPLVSYPSNLPSSVSWQELSK